LNNDWKGEEGEEKEEEELEKSDVDYALVKELREEENEEKYFCVYRL
jgi:hypothetical protein